MRPSIKPFLLTVAVSFFALTNLVVAEEPLSNAEHLKEYGDTFIGEWAQETPADFEFQDIVKKGDTITVRLVNKWVLNKTAISSTWSAKVNGVDVASGQSMTGWDRSAKRIVGFGFNALGGHGQSIIEKRDSKWYNSGMGVGALGHVGASTSIKTIVDHDTQEIFESGRIDSAGKPLANRTLTWNRVKK